MNSRIFKILAERENYKRGEERDSYDKHHGIISINDLAKDFFDFIFPYLGEIRGDDFEKALFEANKYKQAPMVITPAGKNFDAFDRKFIDLIPKWSQYVNLRSRTIDPTSMYVDWYRDDAPPGLGECLVRAGVSKIVTHKASQDCLDTLLVIRKEYDVKKPWMK